MSNSSNTYANHDIESLNPLDTCCCVAPLQRSQAFYANCEANIPLELRFESKNMTLDTRSECTDLSLPEETIIQNFTSIDAFHILETDEGFNNSKNVDAVDQFLSTLKTSSFDELIAQQSFSNLIGIAISSHSPVTAKSAPDIPYCSIIAEPSTSKNISPNIIHSQLRAGTSKNDSKERIKRNIGAPSKRNSKWRKIEKALTCTPIQNINVIDIYHKIEKKSNKSATVVQNRVELSVK